MPIELLRVEIIKHEWVPGIDLEYLRATYSDGMVVDVCPQTYGKYRLQLGVEGSKFYDDGW